MKYLLSILCLFIFITACNSKSDTHISIGKDFLETLKELSIVLDKITDENTYNTYMPQIEDLNEKFEQIDKRTELIGPIDKESQQKLEDLKLDDEAKAVMGSLMKSLMRISFSPYGRNINDIIKFGE